MLQGTAKIVYFIGRIISVSTFLKLGSSHPTWVADHLTNWLLGKNLFRKGGLEMKPVVFGSQGAELSAGDTGGRFKDSWCCYRLVSSGHNVCSDRAQG